MRPSPHKGQEKGDARCQGKPSRQNSLQGIGSETCVGFSPELVNRDFRIRALCKIRVTFLVHPPKVYLTALVIQAVSLRQFLVYRATLPADQVPPGASSVLPWVLTLVLTAVCGGLLFLVA